eukprot:COSAG01_NODE_12997_length_1651_cov_1.161727_2_plen_228_part_00
MDNPVGEYQSLIRFLSSPLLRFDWLPTTSDEQVHTRAADGVAGTRGLHWAEREPAAGGWVEALARVRRTRGVLPTAHDKAPICVDTAGAERALREHVGKRRPAARGRIIALRLAKVCARLACASPAHHHHRTHTPQSETARQRRVDLTPQSPRQLSSATVEETQQSPLLAFTATSHAHRWCSRRRRSHARRGAGRSRSGSRVPPCRRPTTTHPPPGCLGSKTSAERR